MKIEFAHTQLSLKKVHLQAISVYFTVRMWKSTAVLYVVCTYTVVLGAKLLHPSLAALFFPTYSPDIANGRREEEWLSTPLSRRRVNLLPNRRGMRERMDVT